MKILLVSATYEEIIPFYQTFSKATFSDILENRFPYGDYEISGLVTGVGGVATAVALSTHLVHNSYDLIINIGIAGAFNKDLEVGDTVVVKEEIFGDLGVEQADGSFSDLFEIGLAEADSWPFTQGKIIMESDFYGLNFPLVKGISVNKVHGSEDSIAQIIEKYRPDIETMEGAAFYYTCMKLRNKCLQLRSISNFVEKRNRDRWNIPLAINNLTESLGSLLTDEFSLST